MPNHREALPDDLTEFVGLCRSGKLFAVQEWIRSQKRFRCPSGACRLLPKVRGSFRNGSRMRRGEPRRHH